MPGVPATAVGAYLTALRGVPQLTAEQMRVTRAAMRAAHERGDTAARDRAREQLVTGNLRLVVSVAKRHAQSSALPLEDLIGEGNIGLMRAVEKWDERRGTAFSTVAVRWIRKAMQAAVQERLETVHIPAHVQDWRAKLRRTGAALALQLGREPTRDELRIAAGLSEQQMATVRTAEMAAEMASLDAPIGGSFAVSIQSGVERTVATLGDSLAEEPAAGPGPSAARTHLPASLTEPLSAREHAVLALVYEVEMPRERVADAFGLSKERLRQIEAQALRRLRDLTNGKPMQVALFGGSGAA